MFGTDITLPAIFGGGTFLTALIALVKAWPHLRKLSIESDAQPAP